MERCLTVKKIYVSTDVRRKNRCEKLLVSLTEGGVPPPATELPPAALREPGRGRGRALAAGAWLGSAWGVSLAPREAPDPSRTASLPSPLLIIFGPEPAGHSERYSKSGPTFGV